MYYIIGAALIFIGLVAGIYLTVHADKKIDENNR